MSCANALRVVQGVLEVNEMKSLREELRNLQNENKLLKEELNLWKNDCELPVVGNYYIAPNELLKWHGLDLDGYAEQIALRFDGTQSRTVSRVDGTKKHYLEYAFTAPFTYHDDDGRESWIVFHFQTYELHGLEKVLFNHFYWIRYVDANDTIVIHNRAQENLQSN